MLIFNLSLFYKTPLLFSVNTKLNFKINLGPEILILKGYTLTFSLPYHGAQ